MPEDQQVSRKIDIAKVLGVPENSKEKLREAIIAVHESGVSTRETASQHGFSHQTLWRRCRDLGIRFTPGQPKISIAERLGSDADDATAINEWLAADPSRTLGQLAHEINVSYRTLSNRLTRARKSTDKSQH